MSNHSNRIKKMEKRVPGEMTTPIVLEILGAYVSEDEYKTLMQAAVIVERALSPDILHPILSGSEWALIERADEILQRVDQQCKADAVFRDLQLNVGMSKLTDAQLERMSKGASLFRVILDKRDRQP